MTRTVYVNGQYVPEDKAQISIFDRGFIFADGVYEVTSVIKGGLVDFEGHMERLKRSLRELSIALPENIADIKEAHHELIKLNNLDEGVIYLQISRGAADRDFPFPDGAMPTLIMFTQEKSLLDAPLAKTGIKVISVEDIRWARRDIKSVGLLAPVLAKQAAKEAGCHDAWLYQDDYVTEGSSNNAYIVTHDNIIVTRQLSNDILHGITRYAVLALAKEKGMKIEERAFTIEEALQAKEAFITSASTFVYPVIEIDQQSIGNGTPGPIATRLRELYIDNALANLS